jgi:hypothetical protein
MRYDAKIEGHQAIVMLSESVKNGVEPIPQGTHLPKTMESECVPVQFPPLFMYIRTTIRADRNQSDISHIVVTTYSMTSSKWLWNLEPLGPSILLKGSNNGKTINMFNNQTIPLASKSRRDTAAILAAMRATLRTAFIILVAAR